MIKGIATSPTEALARAVALIGQGTYLLGTGNYRGDKLSAAAPWTPAPKTGKQGDYCDCWGLVAYAFRQPRHRPGYNPGGSVTDDINVDAANEDAYGIEIRSVGQQELWRHVDPGDAQPGDLLIWPSVRGPDGKRQRIGHVAIIEHAAPPLPNGLEDLAAWSVIQCSSLKPLGAAIRRTNAAAWFGRDTFRGVKKFKWASRVLRATGAV